MPSSLTQKIEAAQLKEELVEAQRFIAQLQTNYAEKCSEAEVLRVECKQIHSVLEQQTAELHAVIHQLQGQLSVKEQEYAAALSDVKAKHMEVTLLHEQLKLTQASYTTKIDELTGKLVDYERQVHMLQQQQQQQQSESRARLEGKNGGTQKKHSSNEADCILSVQELKEDLLILNTLNQELEEKLRTKSEEVVDLSQQVQKLTCERTQLLLEKDLRETIHSEKIDALTKAIDVTNSEKSKLQDMYGRVMAEYYSMSLNYNILLSRDQEKAKASPKAMTVLRQVCVHNSNKAPQQHIAYGSANDVSAPNTIVCAEPKESFPNIDMMKVGAVDIESVRPKGTKVKTQAGVSFVPETKKLLQIQKADLEKIPRAPTL